MHLLRSAALLATNLLFLLMWGFAGISKVKGGMPSWFDEKFGKTILGTIPGLKATFWILTVSELVAFGLACAALLTGEFLRRRPPIILPAMLVWSLFVYVQLAFGQWLTNEFIGAAQIFAYFSGTLLALFVVSPELTRSLVIEEERKPGSIQRS